MKSVPLLVGDVFEGQAVDICLFRETNINICVDIWYVWYVFLPEKKMICLNLPVQEDEPCAWPQCWADGSVWEVDVSIICWSDIIYYKCYIRCIGSVNRTKYFAFTILSIVCWFRGWLLKPDFKWTLKRLVWIYLNYSFPTGTAYSLLTTSLVKQRWDQNKVGYFEGMSESISS